MSLYTWMRYNPENKDFATLVVSCLLDAEVVPPGYTVEQFRIDSGANDVPLRDTANAQSELERCTNDPLGVDR